jgi:hypothetical protein
MSDGSNYFTRFTDFTLSRVSPRSNKSNARLCPHSPSRRRLTDLAQGEQPGGKPGARKYCARQHAAEFTDLSDLLEKSMETWQRGYRPMLCWASGVGGGKPG